MLNNVGCDKIRDSDDDEVAKLVPPNNLTAATVLSDEALFAACGGRTAHK